MSKYLKINDYMNIVEKVAIENGKPLADTGHKTSYAYALGYVLSNFKYCLDELDLSEKQLEILAKRAEWLNEKGIVV